MPPLTERSTNSQPLIFTPKERYPRLSYTRMSDENTPPRPRTQSALTMRSMGQTKASAARVNTSTVSTPHTTPAQSTSRLPRRAPTPQSAPNNANKGRGWMASMTRRVSSGRDTTEPVDVDSGINREHLEIEPVGCVDLQTPTPANGWQLDNSFPKQDTNKPLPGEKPLPSRPISYMTTLSPSKDSRTLLDAREQPLRRSPGTPDEEEWPALSPERKPKPSAMMPMQTAIVDKRGQEPRPTVPKSALPRLARSPTMVFDTSSGSTTGQLMSKRIRPSLNDPVPPVLRDPAHTAIRSPTSSSARPELSGPARTASLRARISSGSIVAADSSAAAKTTGFTDFSRDRRSPSVCSTPTPGQSRIPPPSSFSRPRVMHHSKNQNVTPRQVSASPRSQPSGSLRPSPSSIALPQYVDPNEPSDTTPRWSNIQPIASLVPIYEFERAKLVQITNRGTSRPTTPIPNVPTPKSELPKIWRRDSSPKFDAVNNSSMDDLAEEKQRLATTKRLTRIPVGNVKAVNHSNPSSRPSTPGSTPSPSDESGQEQTKSKRSGHRVKRVSSNVLSSSYSGATLTISKDADEILLGEESPLQRLCHTQLKRDEIDGCTANTTANRTADAFDTATYSEHSVSRNASEELREDIGPQVELALSHGPTESFPHGMLQTVRAPMSDFFSSAVMQDGALPAGSAVSAVQVAPADEITATLSLLEGNTTIPLTTEVDWPRLAGILGGSESRESVTSTGSDTGDVQSDTQVATDRTVHTEPESQTMKKTDTPAHPRREAPRSPQSEDDQSNVRRTPPAPGPDVRRYSNAKALNIGPTAQTRRASRTVDRVPSNVARPSIPPKDTQSIGYPSCASRKATAVLGPADAMARQRSPGISPITGKRVPTSIAAQRVSQPNSVRRNHLTKYFEPEELSDHGIKTRDFASDHDGGRNGRAVSSDKSVQGVGATHKNSKTPRSRSRPRIAIDNIRGLFSGKRNTKSPKKQPTKDQIISEDRKATVASNGSPIRSSPPPVYKSTASSRARSNLAASSATPLSHRSTSSRNSQQILETTSPSLISPPPNESATMTQLAMGIMEQARSESDSPKKERMLSLAQVMVNALSSVREAERSMLEAQQAAESARMSYELTQRSMVEMGRLIHSSHSMASLLHPLRKLGGRTAGQTLK
ncbi:hypothetical protein LTR50_003064 [Elasticomyces elasticus]|nr:hypothetical protein LTR50_003064 [Elasticomyces elasticus]